jgi:hypothetical protein
MRWRSSSRIRSSVGIARVSERIGAGSRDVVVALFLVFQSMGWINAMSCVVFGFAVGAAPAGVLTWPMQHPGLHMNASVNGVPTIINGIITAAGGVSYIRPLIYFGSFGALGGFAFWAALIWIGTFEKSRRGRRSLTSFSSQTPASREERISATPGSALTRYASSHASLVTDVTR